MTENLYLSESENIYEIKMFETKKNVTRLKYIANQQLIDEPIFI